MLPDKCEPCRGRVLAGAWPEGPEALFVNMMQRYVVPVRRRDWTLSTNGGDK